MQVTMDLRLACGHSMWNMPSRTHLQPAGMAFGLLLAALAGGVEAHVVPSMTVEAGFSADRTFELKINVDPRTFLAADPTTLPPVPAAWYRDQTPDQVAGTHERAQRYLEEALGLLFDGQKIRLPDCRIEAINGEDNTPLSEETQEVHLLATASGVVPAESSTFQLDFARSANTSLILVHTQGGKADLRPQVLFPGETSRGFHLSPAKMAAAKPAQLASAPSPASRLFLVIAISATVILVLVGWRLLGYYRHHHRLHRRPRPNDVNN